jgi:hypothetical protein
MAFVAPAAAAEISDSKKIDIEVHGRIAERCAMGAVGDMDFGDLNRPGLGATTKVGLDCNIPFNMTIKAANGALAHAQMPTGQGPYAGKLPYRIDLSMPIRRPQASTVQRSFESRELTGGGRTISSEGGIAVDGAVLSVALAPPPGEAGLLAGDYGETIEITITPS